jgi:hypothetical protein
MDWAALISVVCEDLANVGIFLVGIAAAYAFKKIYAVGFCGHLSAYVAF